jgi:hypothetical protein
MVSLRKNLVGPGLLQGPWLDRSLKWQDQVEILPKDKGLAEPEDPV